MSQSDIDVGGYRRASKVHRLMFPYTGSRVKQLLIGMYMRIYLNIYI